MAETDILNPTRGYDPELGDSMNPNQGWQRSRQSTLAIVKPAGGSPWSRETGNDGVTFKLDWKRRNLAVTERLHRFFQEFEQGFFTFIDHDSERHYVGRFVGEEGQSFDINGRFSSTGWSFQEFPGAPMLVYPSDFDRWGVKIYPVGDFGDMYASCSATAPNSWTQPQALDANGNIQILRQLSIPQTAPGDRIAIEYRGYGFRLFCGTRGDYGQFNLLLDGANLQTVDCYYPGDTGPTVVYTQTAVPLGLHRVEIIATGGHNGNSTGTALLFDHIEVIR